MEATPEVEETQTEKTPEIVMIPPQQPGEGPPCIWDNAPTRRTGMCWTCIVCGATSSC